MTNAPCAAQSGATTLVDAKGGDMFLLAIDQAGAISWVHQISTPWTTNAWSMLVRDEAIFLGGAYTRGFTWGESKLAGNVGLHGDLARLGR